jgi:rubrerythrin
MNIFDYAMQMEKEGEALYKSFAKNSPQKGLATIFTGLAEQEHKHYKTFKKMKNSEGFEPIDTTFLEDVKGIFTEWKKEKHKFNFNISQADLYRKALDIEQKSIDFYMEKSKEVKDDKQRQIFEKIANEEKSHYEIMENIIEFITKPERWVEHAEFSKIGEEY